MTRRRNLYQNPDHQRRAAAAMLTSYSRAVEFGQGHLLPGIDEVRLLLGLARRSSLGGRDESGFFILVSDWVFYRDEQEPGYLQYLVAHELSHVCQAFNGYRCDHGAGFMRYLQMLCPERLQHYEGEYKPRMARACGLPVKNREFKIRVTLVSPERTFVSDETTVRCLKLTRARLAQAAKKAVAARGDGWNWQRAELVRK